jgi:hypothetical protein
MDARVARFTVWLRRSALRPIPPYARIPARAVASVAARFAAGDERARRLLDEGFERFEAEQPALAEYMAATLAPPLDETALALGYFLCVCVFLSFDEVQGQHLGRVSSQAVAAAEESLCVDEELRKNDPLEALESEDIVAIEQPDLLSFVHTHLDTTLEGHADSIDVDDVGVVYRTVLVQILALSYAVARPHGYPEGKGELLA